LQLVLLAVILGVAFGSLTLYAGYRRALFLFLPLAVLPLLVRMVEQHDAAYYSAAIVLFAVFLFTLFFGRNFGETMSEAVKKNYENEVLVEQLLNEKRLAEEARRAAESAIRSKTQFFAAASHDLRQPLQAIGIYCSLLRKRAQGPLEPLTKNLSSAVESLSKLVEELLEISRLDSGAVQASKQVVDLNEMFSTLRQEFVPIAAAKGLRFRERRAGLYVETDPLLLQRILRNLISNAVRYTTEGGVLLAARRRSSRVSLEVWIPDPASGATSSTGYSRSSIGGKAPRRKRPADMAWACRSFAGFAPCWPFAVRDQPPGSGDRVPGRNSIGPTAASSACKEGRVGFRHADPADGSPDRGAGRQYRDIGQPHSPAHVVGGARAALSEVRHRVAAASGERIENRPDRGRSQSGAGRRSTEPRPCSGSAS